MFTVGGSDARLSRLPIGSDHKIYFLCSEPVFMPISIAAGSCSQHIEIITNKKEFYWKNYIAYIIDFEEVV